MSRGVGRGILVAGCIAAMVAVLLPVTGNAAETVVYSDDFESGVTERWVSGGTNNTWTFKVDPAGNGYLIDTPNGPYAPDTNAHARLVSPIDLSNYSACRVRFSLILDTEPEADILWLEGSGNAETWGSIGGWSGSSNGQWVVRDAPMTAWAGQQTVYLRFRLEANSAVELDGVSIDDLVVSCDPDPSPTPSASPSASPDPGCPAGSRCPSDLTLSLGKTRRALRLSGTVQPPHPGEEVMLSLLKRKDGRFRLVARRVAVLDQESRYEASFRRLRAKRCRVRAAWPGDEDHAPAVVSYRFPC